MEHYSDMILSKLKSPPLYTVNVDIFALHTFLGRSHFRNIYKNIYKAKLSCIIPKSSLRYFSDVLYPSYSFYILGLQCRRRFR